MRKGSNRQLTLYGLFIGALILVVAGLTWVIALGSGAVGIAGLILTALALVGSFWAWTRRKARRRPPTSEQLNQARRDLGDRVREQWLSEAAALRLYQPRPIPTRWRVTEPLISDLPTDVAGEGSSRLNGRVIEATELTEWFSNLNQHRLVIVGEPGTGKTTLAVLLLLEILRAIKSGRPLRIPVMFSLGSYDPEHGFGKWLAQRISDDYPGLRDPNYGIDVSYALVRNRLILPILDGLDEVAAADRPAVITGLTQELADGEFEFILTCRTDAYMAALESSRVLRGTAVAEGTLLDHTVALAYLRACIPEGQRKLWEPVLAHVQMDSTSPLASALDTPLMLWLITRIYVDGRRDPARLADKKPFPDRGAVESYLLDDLVPSLFTMHPPEDNTPSRPQHKWNVRQAQRGLGYLAMRLNIMVQSDFFWWHLLDYTAGSIDPERNPRTVNVSLRGRVRELTGTLAIFLPWGLLIGLFGVMINAVGHYFNPRFVPPVTIHNIFGVLRWGAIALFTGFFRWSAQPTMSSPYSTPLTTLRGDRRLFFFRFVITGLALDAVFGFVAGPGILGVALGVTLGIIGGLMAAVMFPYGGAWPSYVVARAWLLRFAPWRFMRLMDDAHRLGILRQVGAVYQFRHPVLQDHLAKWYEAHSRKVASRLVALPHLDIYVLGNEVRKPRLTWNRSRYLGPLVGAYAGIAGPKRASATGAEPRSARAMPFSTGIGHRSDAGTVFIVFANGARHESPLRKASTEQMHRIETDVAQFNAMANAAQLEAVSQLLLKLNNIITGGRRARSVEGGVPVLGAGAQPLQVAVPVQQVGQPSRGI
jgi:hypothetical protein